MWFTGEAMILTLGLLFTAAEVLIGVVYALDLLSFDRIRGWFERCREAIRSDAGHLRVSLHEKIKNGQHRIIYGIFDARTSTFVQGETVTANRIDPEIASLHQGAPLVIYP